MPEISKIKIVTLEEDEEETFDVKDQEVRDILDILLSKNNSSNNNQGV